MALKRDGPPISISPEELASFKRRKLDYYEEKKKHPASKDVDMLVICEDLSFRVNEEKFLAFSKEFSEGLSQIQVTDPYANVIITLDPKQVEFTKADPKVVAAAIKYMYAGWYDDSGWNEPHETDPLCSHAKVHGFADTWGIVCLRRYAAQKFKDGYKGFEWAEDIVAATTAVYEHSGFKDSVLRDYMNEKIIEDLPHILALLLYHPRSLDDLSECFIESLVDGLECSSLVQMSLGTYACQMCRKTVKMEIIDEITCTMTCVACGVGKMKQTTCD